MPWAQGSRARLPQQFWDLFPRLWRKDRRTNGKTEVVKKPVILSVLSVVCDAQSETIKPTTIIRLFNKPLSLKIQFPINNDLGRPEQVIHTMKSPSLPDSIRSIHRRDFLRASAATALTLSSSLRAASPDTKPGHAALKAGDLTAVIGDNSADGAHLAGYNGVWSLRH